MALTITEKFAALQKCAQIAANATTDFDWSKNGLWLTYNKGGGVSANVVAIELFMDAKANGGTRSPIDRGHLHILMEVGTTQRIIRIRLVGGPKGGIMKPRTIDPSTMFRDRLSAALGRQDVG